MNATTLRYHGEAQESGRQTPRGTAKSASMNAEATLEPPQFQRIATALRYLDEHFQEQPTLEVLSSVAGLSVAHFDRLFHRWAGLTPNRYLQQLTLEAARLELDRGASVIAAAWAAGLSGSSRLHDLFVVAEGTTPGEYRTGGAGVELWHGLAASPFGNVFVAGTARGLAHLAFVDDGGAAAAEFQMAQGKWPEARWREAPSEAAALVQRLWGTAGPQGCVLEVRGTTFQMQVWRALLRQPRARTYGELAAELGRPSAARAVGGAVGDNALAWVIPCHHVLRRGALLGGYRWGLDRKRAMLTYEHASRLVAAG